MKMYTKIMLIFPSSLLLLFLYCIQDSSTYWKMPNFINHKTIYKKLATRHTHGNSEFLIKTPGCSIPDYAKYLTYTNTTHINGTCRPRAVFIEQTGSDKIVFQIDKKKIQKYLKKKGKFTCCFRFGSTAPDTFSYSYTRCIPIQNGKKFKLLKEVITVTCMTRSNKKSIDIFYEDSYILVKKINKKKKNINNSWNILVLGMSTMSRARINDTMPRTVQYLQTYKWLDYKGYHTVGDTMLPNVISLLTGNKITTLKQYCMTESKKCNETYIWRHFENAGYITAFGDDYLEIPDGFPKNQFIPPSTDHYVWPYFHTKYKRRKGNFFCTNNEPSGKQLLDYAYQFVDTYKKNNFFAMFWINTFSSRIETSPTLIDAEIVKFFQKINKTGVLKNTFIMLLSDHGLNSEDHIKTQKESFYEKRLPMLFMWVPYEFQRQNSSEFNNVRINQNRLLSPYDVYSTMMDILNLPNFINHTRSEACPQCTSLFKEKPLQRKCADAGVDDEWCACHILEDTNSNDVRLSQSIKLVANFIGNNSIAIETIPCMTCAGLHTKNVLRTHTYIDNNKMYYVIALLMSPGDISYEATVLDNGKELNIVLPITSISRNDRGNCAINPNDRMFCLCNITVCNKDMVLPVKEFE